MNRIRVKICGITRPEDALSAAELGADAIGLVFHPPSSRAVEIAAAREIIAALPPFVNTVGLFLNAQPAAVEAVLAELPLSTLQFHGQETVADCERYRLPYIKAVPMGEGDASQVLDHAARFSSAQGLLLDSHVGGGLGGLGKRFDWSQIPSALGRPLILAGGLNPDNVADVLAHRPYGVDVSSGVESAPGIKDPERIGAFMAALQGSVGACSGVALS